MSEGTKPNVSSNLSSFFYLSSKAADISRVSFCLPSQVSSCPRRVILANARNSQYVARPPFFPLPKRGKGGALWALRVRVRAKDCGFYLQPPFGKREKQRDLSGLLTTQNYLLSNGWERSATVSKRLGEVGNRFTSNPTVFPHRVPQSLSCWRAAGQFNPRKVEGKHPELGSLSSQSPNSKLITQNSKLVIILQTVANSRQQSGSLPDVWGDRTTVLLSRYML
jgi:hypothetical protein